MQTTPAVAVGDGRGRGDWAGSRDGSVVITLQKCGKSRLVQGGRDVVLLPGDVVIRDLRYHWELDACLDTTLISVKVSAVELAQRLGDLGQLVAVPLRAADRRSALLASVMEHLSRLVFEDFSEIEPAAVRELVFSAARVAYGPGPSDSAPVVDAQQFHRSVFRFVDERVQEPSLTVAELAAELDMSVRSFQRIFHESGTSPRAYILTRRLELAAGRLMALSPSASGCITQVAMDSGFNDPSYFGRAFQQHFGMTPSEYLRRNRSIP
jgi:AraC-like DNA-binding protein